MAVKRARSEQRQGGSASSTALVGPVFLLLAGWFLWGPESLDLPQGEPRAIDRSLISFAPRRKAQGDPPTILVDGSRRTCMDCHRLFRPSEDPPVDLIEHRNITLNHGINDRCRNCHHIYDRNKLVLHDGTVLGFSESASLCGKCHGPIFRDWQRGAHGRTNGYWDASRGEVRRLKCAECHDPHNPRVPAMTPIPPLPGPHTLRMVAHGSEAGSRRSGH